MWPFYEKKLFKCTFSEKLWDGGRSPHHHLEPMISGPCPNQTENQLSSTAHLEGVHTLNHQRGQCTVDSLQIKRWIRVVMPKT
jgi:hypothetical protein